jgi:hypothetical protein
MAKVTMISQVSGTRNGVRWPDVGGTLEVGDSEAVGLIASGLAVPFREGEAYEPPPSPFTEKAVLQHAITKATLTSEPPPPAEPAAEDAAPEAAETPMEPPAKRPPRKRKGA